MTYQELKTEPKNIYIRYIADGLIEVLGRISDRVYGVCSMQTDTAETFMQNILAVSNSMYNEECAKTGFKERDFTVVRYPILRV